MTDRVLEVSQGPVRLRIENRQLYVESDETGQRLQAPLEDVAVLILGTTRGQTTFPVLAELVAAGAAVVVCNDRSLPVCLLLPMTAHTLHPQILRTQIEATLPMRKRAWQAIVRRKLAAQAAALRRLGGEHRDIEALVPRVRSGDPENLEARAARLYWLRVFDDATFRRMPAEGEPPNHLLDYGYAVLRGIVARAAVGAGLHPALGLHHRHRENAFALADDLMEPLRPLVDEAAARIVRREGREVRLDREHKQELLTPLFGRVPFDGGQRTLFEVMARVCARLVRYLRGEDEEFDYPDVGEWKVVEWSSLRSEPCG